MAAITISGVNGIDFNSIVTEIMQYESQPLKAMQDEQTKVQNKDSALVSLAGILSALQAPVNSLTSDIAFSSVAATSSDKSIVTVSANGAEDTGDYEVSISQLAKAQVTKSTNGYSTPTATAATGGSISFTIAGETTDPITITAATTLSDLKQQINDQESGVLASIVYDGTNYKLVITSRETGLANGFTINNSLTNGAGAAVAFTGGQSPTSGNAQNAQNALLSVNGIAIESTSNNVADAISGVTLKLLKTGNVSVSVASDTSPVKNNLKTLVEEYNKLRQFYTAQAKGPLGADPLLRQVLNDVKQVLLTANSNGGRYKYLSEIGLELMSNGELKLDEGKLDAAINSFPADVEGLFQGATGTEGVFAGLKSALTNLDGSSGLVKTARDGIQNTLTAYRDRIDRQQLMLEIRRQELVKQYAAADQAISRLNQMLASISNLQQQSL
jgi:flagellar hook-associated protein 2